MVPRPPNFSAERSSKGEQVAIKAEMLGGKGWTHPTALIASRRHGVRSGGVKVLIQRWCLPWRTQFAVIVLPKNFWFCTSRWLNTPLPIYDSVSAEAARMALHWHNVATPWTP